MTIPEAIREGRVTADLTQTELGELMGVSRQTIWAWETGLWCPIAIDLEKLCKHLKLEFHFTAAGASANTYVDP